MMVIIQKFLIFRALQCRYIYTCVMPKNSKPMSFMFAMTAGEEKRD
jgi:hypothetical protein